MEEREKIKAELERKKGSPIKIQKNLREQLDHIQQLESMLRDSKDAGELLYRIRNKITQALGDTEGKKSTPSIETFTAQEGDLVFAVSDGVSDVLTEEEIYTHVKTGVEQNKPAKEILQDLARAAAESRSPRQKGKVLLRDTKGTPLLFQGDDVGVAGARIERKVIARKEQEGTQTQETQTRYTAEQISRWREDLRRSAGEGSLDEAVAETLLAKALAQNPEFAHYDDDSGDIVYEKFAGRMIPLRLVKDRGTEVVLEAFEESHAPFASKVVPKGELGRLFQQTVDVKDKEYRHVQEDLLQQAGETARRQAK
jgi:hypothetical protein